MNYITLKKYLTLVVLFVVSFNFVGCEKEKIYKTKKDVLNNKSEQIREMYKQMPSRNYGGVTIVGDGILRFQSRFHYETVRNMLKNDCELWDNIFYEKYGHLKKEQIMDIEDAIGFNEFQPILVFEENIGILGSMLFDQQQNMLNQWIENEFSGNNPTDPLIINEYEQALYNHRREICIGDTVYQFRLDAVVSFHIEKIGDWVYIRDLQTSLLDSTNWIKIDNYVPKSDSGEPIAGSIFFTCFSEGILNSADMPEVF